MLQLHHLNTSRSSRIIWLLEALGTEYELVAHQREPSMRAPASLAAVHPLAKAPTIVDGDLVLVESSAILRYISDRYGDGRFQPPANTAERAKHDELLDYAEGSLMTPVLMKGLGRRAGGLPEMLDQFATHSIDKSLTFIAASMGDGPFLMGEALTLADMQMSYCMAGLAAGGSLEGRPALQAYWQNLQAEPGFKRMIALGGPLIPGR